MPAVARLAQPASDSVNQDNLKVDKTDDQRISRSSSGMRSMLQICKSTLSSVIKSSIYTIYILNAKSRRD